MPEDLKTSHPHNTHPSQGDTWTMRDRRLHESNIFHLYKWCTRQSNQFSQDDYFQFQSYNQRSAHSNAIIVDVHFDCEFTLPIILLCSETYLYFLKLRLISNIRFNWIYTRAQYPQIVKLINIKRGFPMDALKS